MHRRSNSPVSEADRAVPRRGSAALAAFLAATSLAAAPAWAEPERTSPLEGQPAVRHRLLLVKHRFELTPAFEGSVNADFKHTLSAGLKLEFHISDMWSIGAVGFYGTGVDTGLNGRISDDLPNDVDDGDPTPTQNQWDEHLNTMPLHGAGYITILNKGTSDDRLVSASSPVAGMTQIHEMKMEGDVMKMRAVPHLDLPAGRTTELKPGGYHIMLMDLKKPLAAGTSVPLTLTFRDAGGAQSSLELKVPVAARAPGAATPADSHKH